MKYILFATFLIFTLTSFNTSNKDLTDLEYELSRLVSKFKAGFDTEDDFEDLEDNLDDLEDDIEDALDDDDDTEDELKKLLETVESCTSFIGEISPKSGNSNLRMGKFDIAMKVFDLNYSWLAEPDEHCLRPLVINLWGKYESLLLANFDDCLFKFDAVIVTNHVEGAPMMSTSSMSGGVGRASLRMAHSGFLKDNHPLMLYSLSCEKTSHCGSF